MKIVVMVVMSVVVLEFGIHVVYHFITGKAGLDDPPFQYLVDIFKSLGKRNAE